MGRTASNRLDGQAGSAAAQSHHPPCFFFLYGGICPCPAAPLHRIGIVLERGLARPGRRAAHPRSAKPLINDCRGGTARTARTALLPKASRRCCISRRLPTAPPSRAIPVVYMWLNSLFISIASECSGRRGWPGAANPTPLPRLGVWRRRGLGPGGAWRGLARAGGVRGLKWRGRHRRRDATLGPDGMTGPGCPAPVDQAKAQRGQAGLDDAPQGETGFEIIFFAQQHELK